ncbi:hypothetical protein Mp_8g17970 [Marchantia polymorpha subsp. ruderalis]|uniref:Uncharacterized protein n=1 Tax=Marchantia polymorpha TaxID=3197 RepID=A0A2R6X8I4_MARPO|nr:hypothetical protein MARPO_0030s0131 [Marchantia polymorpha]BBN20291.1 hypothetical protein Mp_8g17970 [Marchantia polymorpha subsp. ruderalis]|eukprot:PTQ42411.1 hypothetical protein MARPO_0030s0131 [Marchantia polymorpha]
MSRHVLEVVRYLPDALQLSRAHRRRERYEGGRKWRRRDRWRRSPCGSVRASVKWTEDWSEGRRTEERAGKVENARTRATRATEGGPVPSLRLRLPGGSEGRGGGGGQQEEQHSRSSSSSTVISFVIGRMSLVVSAERRRRHRRGAVLLALRSSTALLTSARARGGARGGGGGGGEAGRETFLERRGCLL